MLLLDLEQLGRLRVGGDRFVDYPVRLLWARPVQKPGELDPRRHNAGVQPNGVTQQRLGSLGIAQTGRRGTERRSDFALESRVAVARLDHIVNVL